MTRPVYILGGYQTDFARNWTKEGKHISAMIREAVVGGLQATGVEPAEIEVGHVGNFAAELYAMQGHLGAFLVDVDRIMGFGFNWAPPGALVDLIGARRTVALLEAAKLPVPRVLVDAAERNQRLFDAPHVDVGRFFHG